MTSFLPVVAIVGPTAVGKTECSIALAVRLDGEIISADSRLIYRGMDIGTAKPTAEQRALVPHHLIDVADPQEVWTLAAFRTATLEAIHLVHARGKLPLLVGGTGQYVTAILEGWTPPPRPDDAAIRRSLEDFAARHGPGALHDRLRSVDPESAARIDPRNVRRVVRALEVFEATGTPASRLRGRQAPLFQDLRIGLTLPRQELYARIDSRIEAMIEAGLVDEVRRLSERALPPAAAAMSAIGYRQIAAHLRGETSLEEAMRRMRRATRQFVRRQANWFKAADPRIHWFEARPGVEHAIEGLIRAWLESRGRSGDSPGEPAKEKPGQRR